MNNLDTKTILCKLQRSMGQSEGCTCGRAAAEQAYPVHGHGGADLDRAARVDNRVLAEARHGAVVVHGLPADGEAGGLVAVHDALPLQAERLAHVAFPRHAVLAAHALPDEDGERMVTDLELGHAFPNTLNHSADQR